MLVSISTAAEEQERINRLLAEPVTQPCSEFWQYPKSAVILGRSQPIKDPLAQRAKALDVEIVRRSSGGGAVMAGQGMLGGVVVFGREHPFSKLSLPESFVRIGAIWQRVLHDIGVDTELVCDDNRQEKTQQLNNNGLGWVCFAGLSYGELTDADNRKMLGLAQVRRRSGIAVVAGLLVEPPPWSLLLDVWQGEAWRDDLLKHVSPLTQLNDLTSSVDQHLHGKQLPSMESLVDDFERVLQDTTFD